MKSNTIWNGTQSSLIGGNYQSNKSQKSKSPIIQKIIEDEDEIKWDKPIKCKSSEYGHEIVREITKLIESNYYHFGGWSNAYETILNLILYALTGQEGKYMEIVKPLKKEALNCAVSVYNILFKALYYDFCIYDILGGVYMQLNSLSKQKWFGQFFTPFNICEMMSKMIVGDIKSQIKKAKKTGKKITVNEPCVGSGAMLLALKKNILQEVGIVGLDYFEFYGQDIDAICVKMCKIQMILTNYKYMANLLITTAYEMNEKVNKNEK